MDEKDLKLSPDMAAMPQDTDDNVSQSGSLDRTSVEDLNLPSDAFEPLPKDEAQDNENIAGPSLSFGQNVWLRFKQRKAAVLSAIIVIVMAQAGK